MILNPPQLHVLICPLNWGLGHATRMIPLAHKFMQLGARVTFAASGAPLQLLKQEFSARANYITLPGVNIRYSKSSSQVLAMAKILPLFIFNIGREHRLIKKIAGKINPDIIISDNRYGVRTKDKFSILVTHQLNIKLPLRLSWLEGPVNYLNHKLIKKFHLCLVPDTLDGTGLAGELSHNTTLKNILYTGPLSRFSAPIHPVPAITDLPADFIAVILSGPEPQRSILEERLKQHLTGKACVWFRGLPGSAAALRHGNHWFFNHADTATMASLISRSSMVICRSGYSTVMDMASLGKKCVMIPTPGQSEQEYLAAMLSNKDYISAISQDKLSFVDDAIEEALKKPGLPYMNNTFWIREIINRWKKWNGETTG